MTVGLTVGCWDRLHEGHVQHLEAALAQCDQLIVVVMSQAWMRLTKGVPLDVSQCAATREVLVRDALRHAAHRVRFVHLDVPVIGVLAQVVDVVFVGPDQTWHQLPENEAVLRHHPTVTIPRLPGVSSTQRRAEDSCADP